MGASSNPVTCPFVNFMRHAPLFACCHHSRPDSVNGGFEEVFQPALSGKYACDVGRSLGDFSNIFSQFPSTSHYNQQLVNSECNRFFDVTPVPPTSYCDEQPVVSDGSGFSVQPVLQPGRTVESIMEAPDPSNPVEQNAASALHSRPGPVVGCGSGVFQHVIAGEYPSNLCNEPSVPDASFFSPYNSQPNSCIRGHLTDHDVRIYYQNVGGMNCDVNAYLLAASDDCYDVVVLTETWLDSRTLSHQVFGPEFEVFLCDRGPVNSRKLSGGGVLVAVTRRLKTKEVKKDLWDSIEQVWVCIELANRKVYLCGIHVSPDRVRDDTLLGVHSQSVI